MKVLYSGSDEKKNSGKEMNKIEARLAERKQEMNILKINFQNVKMELNDMQQVQMEYREMNIWNVNEFNFLNEEDEEFTSRWSQKLVNVRTPSYVKQGNFEYCL